MQKLTDYRRPVYQVEFSPDGDLLAGLGQKNLWCWTRSRDWELSGLQHPTRLGGLAFHPSGFTITYSGFPPPIWARGNHNRPTDIQFHALNSSGKFAPIALPLPAVPGALPNTVPFTTSLAFTPDRTTLLAEALPTPSNGRLTLLSWRLECSGGSWRALDPQTWDGQAGTHRFGERCLAFIGPWGVRACQLDDRGDTLFAPPLALHRPVAVAATGELVAGVAADELRVWHLRVAEPVAVHRLGGRTADVLAFSPDRSILALAWRDREVQFCDPLRGFGESFDFGVGRVEAMAFAPDGLTLAIAGVNALVVVDVG